MQENFVNQETRVESKKFYTVLDLIEVNEHKILQCKSPFKNEKGLLKFVKDSYMLPKAFQVSLLQYLKAFVVEGEQPSA